MTTFADPVDEAAARQQQMIDNALANRQRPQMVYTGECHYCEDPIDSGHFCTHECRDDHVRLMKARTVRGLS